MIEKEKKKNILTSFPRAFWMANLMELFERGAYHGMNSVLAVYLVKVLFFREQAVGFLQGFFYLFTFVLPILGGALAERYGYRKMLLVCFSLLAMGYFAVGYFTSYSMIFVFLLVAATGSGLFKPIITSTVAKTTTKETSSFGFALYYWTINLGGFLAPLWMSYVKGFNWRYVFFSAGAWSFFMLLPSIFLYKDPEMSKNTQPMRNVLKEAVLVLSDSRFMLMIVIYSTFWISYFQLYGPVLWYLRDFVYRSPVDRFMASLGISFTFDIEHVTVINAGIIILLVVLVSRIIKNINTLPVIVVGVTIGSAAFVVMAFSPSAWIFILAIVILSIGEMIAQPQYYKYIGIIAPKDKVAVYMGYAFLYGVGGSLIGSNVGAMLYEKILKPVAPSLEAVTEGIPLSVSALNQAKLFWIIFALIGFCCTIGMVLYNRFFAQDTPEANRRAWKIMLGIYVFFVIAGLLFLIYSLFFAPEISWRTLVQSLIMLGVGAGGILISLRKGATEVEIGR
ncbi:MFS transporter [Candidatus Pacearchaeota archaeon]|nr:MFS transporter [Candidatus Pacearchaeota archaeon]